MDFCGESLFAASGQERMVGGRPGEAEERAGWETGWGVRGWRWERLWFGERGHWQPSGEMRQRQVSCGLQGRGREGSRMPPGLLVEGEASRAVRSWEPI